MDLTDAVFEAANQRGLAKQAAFPAVVAVRYDRRIARVVISLSTGLDVTFSPRDAQGLEHARPSDLVDAQISPSGLGVHFPKLDADIDIPGLLEGFLGSKNWMAARMGQRGGKASTEAKSNAARANGRLGGRPRKAKPADIA
ncbi:DUF2442 domain-containing protein [Rhodoferax sp. U2-2l]|uniref:DUF2442 domain-containing protein n=1 Tax=Rhodoferax sp. U2-2l TaxID=2884000 RepID=UPI001D0ABD44|nr:DUF2442 domain-containing protein [Rhodoferax sp. U2-2l]MCB8747340.1 DUF2442 domain-containing protein [Rhodoferax sp. U2-2l]